MGTGRDSMARPARQAGAVAAGRALVVLAFAVWWLRLGAVNAGVEDAWRWLLQQWWFVHDSFEPALSVACFAVFLPVFAVVDIAASRALTSKAAPVCVKQWIAAGNLNADQLTDLSQWKLEGHVAQEALVYIAPIFTFDYFVQRRAARLAASATPTSQRVASEILLGLFFYDLFFTVAHYAMHRSAYLYNATHAKHHEKPHVRARDVLRLTAAEEVVDVAASIAALNLIGAHPLSRALYNVVIVYLLCELHSSWNLPWQLQRLVPFGLWGGSVRHEAHHAKGSCNYQKFFTYLDDYVLPQRRHGPTAAAIYNAIHAKHYEKPHVHARDVLRLTAAEEVVDVAASVAALNLIGAHPLSRALYNVVIVYLLCELHSSWNLPWQLQRLVPFGLWGGSVRHEAHHAKGSCNYQKFFTYLDDYVLPQRRHGPTAAAVEGS
ncbi:hypothetical protein DIPPA_11441 [Diplonema papillatum]|nr:hypothetical protein DIPPA_11441 [Diplonema papillatum]